MGRQIGMSLSVGEAMVCLLRGSIRAFFLVFASAWSGSVLLSSLSISVPLSLSSPICFLFRSEDGADDEDNFKRVRCISHRSQMHTFPWDSVHDIVSFSILTLPPLLLPVTLSVSFVSIVPGELLSGMLISPSSDREEARTEEVGVLSSVIDCIFTRCGFICADSCSGNRNGRVSVER